MIDFGSVCSGIESASVALEPLGFRAAWFSEIEKFPSAVLRHHWPLVPNMGDMMRLPWLIRAGLIPAPAVLIGGTPCQAFSVAGARGSLSDERGGLTLAYVEVLNAIDEQRPDGDEAACIWENVPGVLSTPDNAFGCFLGKLGGDDVAMEPGPRPAAGKSSAFWSWSKTERVHYPKWPKSGAVVGPRRRIAWRVLDAQYFGLAQRRKRVFVVASARNGFDPCAVLFEPESVRRDTPPSRETPEAVAGPLACRATSGGGPGTDGAAAGHLQPIASPVTPGARRADRGDGNDNLIPAGGCWWDGGQVSQTLDAVLHKGQTMPEKNRFPAVLQPVAVTGDVAHTLKAEGFDGSEDGTGRGTPIVSVHGTQDPDVREGYAHTLGRNNGQENAIAYSVEVCPTLRSGGNATGGDRPPGTDVDTADSNIVTDLLAVRRLMPVECERLQGFPDNHTSVPDWYECGCGHSFAEELGKYGCPNCCGENVARRKSTVDGPRYMSIGNSKAVPVVQWVGRRLKQELTQCDRY